MLQKHELKSWLYAGSVTFSLAVLFLLSVPAKADVLSYQVSMDRNVARGQEAMQAGDYEAAVANFRKAVRKSLSSGHRVMVQNSLCASLLMTGDNEAAAEACSAAINGDSHYWKAYVNRGHARRALGDTAGALADYCAANRLSPNHVSGQFETQCEG